MDAISKSGKVLAEKGETSSFQKSEASSSGITDWVRHTAQEAGKKQQDKGESSSSQESQSTQDLRGTIQDVINCYLVTQVQKIGYTEVKTSKAKGIVDWLKEVIPCVSSEARFDKDEKQKSLKTSIEGIEAILKKIKGKLDNLVSPPYSQIWQEPFLRIATVLMNEAVKGNGMREPETRINNLKNKYEQMSENLDPWFKVYEAQEKLERALAYVPDKYRSLAREMARKDLLITSGKFNQILGGYIEKNTNPSSQENQAIGNFKTAYDSLTSRLGQLENVCKEHQLSLIQERRNAFVNFMNEHLDKVPEVMVDEQGKQISSRDLLVNDIGKRYREAWNKYKEDQERWEKEKMLDQNKDHEEFNGYIDNFGRFHTEFIDILSKAKIDYPRISIIEEGIEHEASVKYLLACIGNMDKISYQNEHGIGDAFQSRQEDYSKYRNWMDNLHSQYPNGFHNQDTGNVSEYVEELKRIKEELENELRENKWLE